MLFCFVFFLIFMEVAHQSLFMLKFLTFMLYRNPDTRKCDKAILVAFLLNKTADHNLSSSEVDAQAYTKWLNGIISC